jgi:2-C-methyl-D-erythritol 4-phosphate cytidylyltransferase
MFRFGVLKQALGQALSEGFIVTDESSALEHAGFEPKLVKGSHTNIKITTKDDLLLAEQFLL